MSAMNRSELFNTYFHATSPKNNHAPISFMTTMKAFCMTEGEKYGLTPNGIWTRIKRGWYRNLIKCRYTNSRVVLVERLSDADPVSKSPAHIHYGTAYMRSWRAMKTPEFGNLNLFNRRNKIT